MSLRSPLGRAIGLGSAKSGYSHWWGQRLSAAALAPLGLWFMFSIMGSASTDYWAAAAWVGETPHAVMLILFLAALLYHSNLGVVVIIEDYVTQPQARVVTLVLARFAHLVMAVVGIYSVLKLSLGVQG